ncbi:DUF448 domain-containing protein [Qipengyuania sp. JC766]|uniref:DUF448 domain-containing protein n=1 Tax=Qipengyuania sp. JC766 TaxID=3232139 RepID=UPI00345B1E61
MRTPNNESLTADIADTARARTNSGSARSCPERRCILTGETAPRAALVRLAISPDGQVLPDPHAKAPGRGAWLGVSRSELEATMEKGRLRGALARAFKGAPLSVPEDLPDRIAESLVRALQDRLGLEMRTGALILGSERIAEKARMGTVALLLHASDSSEGGRSRLDQAWRVGRDMEGSGDRGIVLPLDRTALSVALGRENVVHLALADDASAARIMAILARLTHFIGHDTVPSTETDTGAAPLPGDEPTE